MSEPERISAGKGLGGQLLASARSDRMSDASRDRALAAAAAGAAAAGAAAALASAVAPTAVAAGAAGAARAGAWALPGWKRLAIGVAGTAVALGVTRAVLAPAPEPAPAGPPTVAQAAPPTAMTPPAAPLPATDPVVAAPTPPDPVAPPVPPPAPRRTPAAAAAASPAPAASPALAAAPAAAPVRTGSSLGDEVAALDKAKRALSAGDAPGSLAILDGYDHAFPRGALSQEATALRIEALARSGRTAEARTMLAALRAKNPDSPLLDKLTRLVQP